MSGGKAGAESVPMWVVDGFEEVEAAAESLARAVECAGVAMRTEFADPGDFMRGTLDVLMLAADRVGRRAAKLRRKAEKRAAGSGGCSAAGIEAERGFGPAGAEECPWRLECEEASARGRWLDAFASRMADEAVILAEMLLAERGEECTHESLNATMAKARAVRESNARAERDAGDRLPDCVLEAMEERRG